ncbi:hypothetical protein Prubr_55760 [Polymorphospora rubra]|uniref:Uncharacterized protein n=2 Tax=Polymorphospora rubra TaxID=338584 RepID=A0A810NB39_9ACTN|nr:hypothetical protein Prubr_55760 [Polymorphospora rubra]
MQLSTLPRMPELGRADRRQSIADLMRSALASTDLRSSVAPDIALVALRNLVAKVLAAADDDLPLVIDSDVLGDVYGFAAMVNKSVAPAHPARRPNDRSISAPELAKRLHDRLPGFAARRTELLAQLDATYPTGR